MTIPRKPENSAHPYQITNRCINRDWFSMPMDQVWNLMESYLYLTQKCFNLKIHSFVLMSNHYHMIASAPEGNLSQAIGYFQKEVSLRITKEQNRINHLWAKRFKRCELTDYHYFINTYKYVYQNPLRAKICLKVEDYRYSTLNGLLGTHRLLIPLEEDPLLFDDDFDSVLKWLNQKPKSQDLKSMRLALRRSVFKLPKTEHKKNRLEHRPL